MAMQKSEQQQIFEKVCNVTIMTSYPNLLHPDVQELHLLQALRENQKIPEMKKMTIII